MNERLHSEVRPAMVQMGYTLATQDDRSLTFTKKFRPTWAIVLAVVGFFFFFLGLLFLLVKDTETVFVTVDGDGKGSTVQVTGARNPWVGESIERRFAGEGFPLNTPPPPPG